MNATQLKKIQSLPWKQINEAAKAQGLDPSVIGAIVLGESGGDQYAVRFEPGWKYYKDVAKWAKACEISQDTELTCQKMSWGLMQVMGTVAREHGYTTDLSRLVMIEDGLLIGCRKFLSLMKRYKNNVTDAASAFNAGSVSKTKSGAYGNQAYVDKFKRNLADVEEWMHS